MLLIIHRLLRFRQLRHLRYYRHDPLVGRLLGLKHLPDRSGNVHDSNGAETFILLRIKQVQAALPGPGTTDDHAGTGSFDAAKAASAVGI